MTLGDIGERGFIERIEAQLPVPPGEGVRLAIGDDTAIFDPPSGHSLLFCSDLVAENTHFLKDLHPADSVAYKAVASNISDIGAMGGVPLHYLLSFAAPASLELQWIDAFIAGLQRACRDFNVSLLGGDSSSSDLIFADVSMVGAVPGGKAILRSGAKAGDGIYVTGSLGASMLGLDRLKAGKRDDPAVLRHLYPTPRHRVGQAVADRTHAMIDISDGLSTDLTHVLERSKVSARIYKEKIPAFPEAEDHHVLHGGEEYELIIIAPDLPETVEGIPVARIGEIIESAQDHQIFLIAGSQEAALLPRGWQHFMSRQLR